MGPFASRIYRDQRTIDLRQTIASSFFHRVTADEILMSAGAEEGIYCAINTLVSAQDHVIAITPAYQSL